MVTGIIIVTSILILGLLSGLGEARASGIYEATIVLSVILLSGTLLTQVPEKSTLDELKELQKFCLSIGVATTTPIITESKFILLRPAEVPVQLPYVTATGTISIGVSHD